jgi:internalin A
MKIWKLLAVCLAVPYFTASCDEKTEATAPATTASTPASASAPPHLPPSPEPTASATPTWKKKLASECPAHPSTIDFGDQVALEHEVRRKVGKDAGPITPADLAQIKSINLSAAQGAQQLHQIDPCIFPMFTSLKDLFLGPGEYDDLTPIQKLTTLDSLRASSAPLKDIHPIEGLKRLDRLDLSHTLVGDDELKAVGSLVNVTELMLDEDPITDLTPVANLKKLERLSIKKTQVKNLAPIATLRSLKFLYIAETPVSDITPVQPLIAGGMKLIQN